MVTSTLLYGIFFPSFSKGGVGVVCQIMSQPLFQKTEELKKKVKTTLIKTNFFPRLLPKMKIFLMFYSQTVNLCKIIPLFGQFIWKLLNFAWFL